MSKVSGIAPTFEVFFQTVVPYDNSNAVCNRQYENRASVTLQVVDVDGVTRCWDLSPEAARELSKDLSENADRSESKDGEDAS